MTLSVRYRKCQKGSGAIISTAMFFLIAILFIGGTFVWQVNGQTQVNALDTTRMQERYMVTPTFSYNQDNDAYSAIVHVQNIGPIELKLVQA